MNWSMRQYEVVIILDPSLDERTLEPTLQDMLALVGKEKGKIDNLDIWGKRRFAYEIDKKEEGYYAVADLTADIATVNELDRLLSLNESVLRTKVLRLDK